MKKYRLIIIMLMFIVLIVSSVLIYVNYIEEKIIFTLFGDTEIVLYQDEKYVEYGYIAMDSEGNNLNKDVIIKSNLDTTTPGTYKIKYSIKVGLKTYKDERRVIVNENLLKDIDFSLKGSSIINLQVNTKFQDPGVNCVHKITGKDLSKYVSTVNNINNYKEGEYEIVYRLVYDGKEKILRRKVFVFEQMNSHTISTTSLTNKPVSIKFKSYIYNFAYVICPNETVVYNSEFNYNFFKNGEYYFYVYDTLDNYTEYVIKINNIDMTPPSGTCDALLKNGKTTYSVKSSDDDILHYLYNSEDRFISNSNNYVADIYHRDAKVLLIDKAGNKKEIMCKTERTYAKVKNYFKKNEIDYSSKSDSLVININETNGYYITHIWAKDPYLQLKKEMLSEDSKSLKKPSIILNQAIEKYNLSNKIVFGGNASGPVLKGSHYSYVAKKSLKYNLKEPSSLLVYNGELIFYDYEDYPGNTVVYYINASNELSYIPGMDKKTPEYRKEAFDKALASGVYNTFAFNPVLVENGIAKKVPNDYNALRNGFCQLDENNFLSVVSKTKTWIRQDFADYMAKLGCKTAVNFDGGGSVALFYKDQKSANFKTLSGNNRALSSVFYFTEL